MKTVLKIVGILAIVGIVVFAVLQLIRPDVIFKPNPPAVREAVWPSEEGKALAKRACFECHSNESTWPWYSYVAPVSWLLANHVTEGRQVMNFSDWQPDRVPPPAALEYVIREKVMPLPEFLLMHPEARLTDQEKEALIEALKGLK